MVSSYLIVPNLDVVLNFNQINLYTEWYPSKSGKEKLGVRLGIYGERSRFTTDFFLIQDCMLLNSSGSSLPLFDSEIYLEQVENGTIQDNIINNNFKGTSFVYTGISIDTCMNIKIINNTITKNYFGLYFTKLYNSFIEDNSIIGNSDIGINVDNFENNTIKNNLIFNNDGDGISFVVNCHNNMIYENEIRENYIEFMGAYGLYIHTNCNNNRFYHNNIIDNFDPMFPGYQAWDDGSNFWDNGYPDGGNYWNDYIGVDFNSTATQNVPPPDGIGDTPQWRIFGSAGAQDNYPLMAPWTPPPASTGSFDWHLVENYSLISCPQSPVEKGGNGIFDSYDALELCYAITGDSNISIQKMNGTTTVEQNFAYGDNETSAFPMYSVHGYRVNLTIPGSYIVNVAATNYTNPGDFTAELEPGWNLLGFPHNYTPWTWVPRAKDFTDGSMDPDLDIDGPLTKIIVTEWEKDVQWFHSYVVQDSFPGLESHNWYWDFSYSDQPGNAFWLWVDLNATLTFNEGIGSPIFNLSKSGPAFANTGETITYTINYSNEGDGQAYNVEIQETYPADVTFISSVPAPTSGTDTWDLGTVLPGTHGFINITVQVNIDAIGVITNQVQAAYDNSTGSPQTPVWDTCSTTIIDPYMVISKEGPAFANSGEIITYWINYSNVGTDWAYDVSITETYPADVTFIGSVPAPTAGDNYWFIGAIAPGGSGSIQITMQIDAGASGTLTNCVSLDYNNSVMPLPQEIDCCDTIIIPPTGPVQNIDTGEYFNDIQTAIDDVDTLNGHTIEVSAGIYYENVVVNKQLTLIGEDRDTTIIDANGVGNVIRISANNVTISGFSIINSESPNGYSGIDMSYSSGDHIFDNNISDNYYGIHLYQSNNTIIENNLCSFNEVHCIKVGYKCNGNIITTNTFSNTKYSICLWMSSNNTISNNTCQDNWIGVYLLTDCDNNLIENNTLTYSSTSGIILSASSDNTITNNTISNNSKGIHLGTSCSNNHIFHNNFINNTVQAFDVDNNSWDNGYPSGGNYWSDYAGTDMFNGPGQDISGSDGIGDTPYVFDFAQDNYPLWPYGTNDTTPPEHLNEYPPINGISFNLTPVISVDVVDISGVNASTIRLYVSGFMIFYDLNAITDGYTVSYWHEGGFTEGQNVSCRIVAEDDLGNKLDFTWYFTADIGISYPISLHVGWNLISFPIVPMDTSVENLLSSISGSWDNAKWYDANDPTDPWKSYSPAKPASLNDLTDIDNTMGFWLHVTDSTDDLIIYGNEPVTTNIMLKAGWNLVSYPSNITDTVADALWGTGADRVECYDAGTPYLIKEMGPADLMSPGNGYWVHVLVDSVWTVDW